MNMLKTALPLGIFILVATAAPVKAEPQFCMYENPNKPEENLYYRTGRKYPASAPGCYVVHKGMPKPGGTATILWPDGITTKIVVKTLVRKSRGEVIGTATVDGEIADMDALEEYCFVIRANEKKICF